MLPRKSLLLCAALFGLAGCDGLAGTDPANCAGGKCDDPSQISKQELMPRAPQASGTIAIHRRGDEWFFEVVGPKGEIVLLSEAYTSRGAALNGVLSSEENGVLAERYELVDDGSSVSFVLKAANGQVLADSESFASRAEAESAARSARDLVANIVQYKAAMTHGAAFDLARDGGDWSFSMNDEEGVPMLVSQSYSRRTNALTGIASVRNNGKELARYRLLSNPPRFILKAANGEEIAASARSYDSEDGARAAMESTQALLQSERVANPW
jgi:uncharacterized protein YegP (UPF0339 family)